MTTRPADRGGKAVGRLAARAWSLPPQRNQVAVEHDVQVPMSDGTVLLATHYIPGKHRDGAMPARLVVGPWTHLDITSQGNVVINESLAWLDRYAGHVRRSRANAGSATRPDHPVRIWVVGEVAGEWRETGDWPPPGGAPQRWYLGAHGSLSTAEPTLRDIPAAGFRYDPADPTPSPGGAVLAARRGRPHASLAGLTGWPSEQACSGSAALRIGRVHEALHRAH